MDIVEWKERVDRLLLLLFNQTIDWLIRFHWHSGEKSKKAVHWALRIVWITPVCPLSVPFPLSYPLSLSTLCHAALGTLHTLAHMCK